MGRVDAEVGESAEASWWARLRPWEGRAETADRVVVAGIGLRSLYGLAMLPLIPLLLGPHPLLLELLSGSTVAQVVVGARVRLGEVDWPVAIAAGLPVWVVSDWLYWWAGRRWGERAVGRLLALGPASRAPTRAARLERAVHRLGPWGVLLAWFVPVPRALLYAAAGLGGMRLWLFLVLSTLGTALAVTAVVSLGFALGRPAVELVERLGQVGLAVTLVLVLLVAAWVGRTRARRSARA